MPPARRISLIGYRACGKTTVGKALAKRLNWQYVDADEYLERTTKRRISDIFRQDGEPAFRQLESRCLQEILAGGRDTVLSTGGGCVLSAGNRDLLRGGVVIYLEASAALLQQRLGAHHGGRPSLTGGSVVDEVPRVLAEREPLYRLAATHTVPADQPVEQIVDAIVSLVENPG